ncbi:glycosyltransferase family 2 protein [Neoroseomonas rubea]|uniref:glycosyltransferase family 2 protein n=1 Tax=Neoroseomonas rubea TaxID=2748666 RepID=UPI0018DF4FC8|nr:glycosyltransferase family 2 protein [Roseomonas rubea]
MNIMNRAAAILSDDRAPRALSTAASRHPFVSIVIPALNEERYIEACLASLVGQWPDGRYEILVLDGGSTDRTAEIVEAFRAGHGSVVALTNPRRNQSAAMNLAAQLASPHATVLLRADAHALYPPDFVRRCVGALLRTGATSVVVPMRTEARSGAGLQRAIAAAQGSRLGNGGALHRMGGASGFVEHGHHAAFDRAFFRSIGGYDETFTQNEDAEFDVRAAAAGGRIWMCAEALVVYFPRDSLDGLARQYFRHGCGRARTLRKHHLRPRPRQMIPVLALGGCAAGITAAPIAPMVAALVLIYPACCIAWGMLQTIRRRDTQLMAAGLALMTMHLCWALGFVVRYVQPRPGPVASSLPARSSDYVAAPIQKHTNASPAPSAR